MTKIALCSDLHLEFRNITLSNTEKAKVLILSGDICVAHSLHEHPTSENALTDDIKTSRHARAASEYRQFFNHVSSEYEHVVYVAGNHEGYHGRYPDFYDWIYEEMKAFPNIHFLEQDSIEIDGYVFVGGTLWTDMNKSDPITMHLLENMINDFRVIRNSKLNYRSFSPIDAFKHHKDTVSYIQKIVDSDATKKYIVVSHHAPTFLSVHPKYQKEYYMNGGYASNLFDFIYDRPQIKLWTLGHMHDPHCYYVGDTFVACNPRGYLGHDPEAKNFKLRIIDLDNMPEKFDGVRWSRD